MLFEEGEAEARLPGDCPRGRLLCSRDQAEESCLSTSIAADDSPPLAAGNCESDAIEDSGGTEFNSDIRDRDLCQERSTLEHAARQRSTDSTVWSPI